MPDKDQPMRVRVENLLSRYEFAGAVLLAALRQFHGSCCSTTPCRGMESLTASLDRMHRDSEELLRDYRKRRSTSRRT